MRNSKGFTLIEILIVLVIMTILALTLLPNIKKYSQKAQFADNITAAAAVKQDVEMCIVHYGADCVPGSSNGSIPITISNYGGYVSTVTVSQDLNKITATSVSKFGPNSDAPYTFILQRTVNANDVTVYSVDPTSTCIAAGIC
jgi:prepilin-type N-terminal cleavage/methylation domain-containing protein